MAARERGDNIANGRSPGRGGQANGDRRMSRRRLLVGPVGSSFFIFMGQH